MSWLISISTSVGSELLVGRQCDAVSARRAMFRMSSKETAVLPRSAGRDGRIF